MLACATLATALFLLNVVSTGIGRMVDQLPLNSQSCGMRYCACCNVVKFY